jgi:hypothetical protein
VRPDPPPDPLGHVAVVHHDAAAVADVRPQPLLAQPDVHHGRLPDAAAVGFDGLDQRPALGRREHVVQHDGVVVRVLWEAQPVEIQPVDGNVGARSEEEVGRHVEWRGHVDGGLAGGGKDVRGLRGWVRSAVERVW